MDRSPVEFARRLGLAWPLVQAPMAGSQHAALAVAAASVGALGSLPAALMAPEVLRAEAAAVRAAGRAPLNLNFFAHATPAADAARDAAWRATLAPYYEELGASMQAIPAGPGRRPFDDEACALVEALRPEVVSFHFGLPAQALLDRVRRSGAQVWSSATTVDEARWLQEHGADAVIAQGSEAGGHRGMFLSDDVAGQAGLVALLPQVVDAVRLPVIAAGGIADERGVAAALALGASAVQVGTVLLLCPEASTSAVHRAALKAGAAGHTALTNLFSGRPARGIVNRLMRELGPLNAGVPAFPLAANTLAPLRAAAEKRGSGDFSPMWAGQNASACREVPAAQVLRQLARGFGT